MVSASSSSLLRVEKVTKSFGATRALDQIHFETRAGSVHAVVGENGAGKSTLMKVLTGALKPDRGRIFFKGRPFYPKSPDEARARGIAIVHQETSVCPELSVEENIFLGTEPARWGFVAQTDLRKAALSILAKSLGREAAGRIDPSAPTSALGPSERQLVAIARALGPNRPDLLILDEPTSCLAGNDAAQLFAVIRRLCEDGVCVLYITHFLEEVRQLADRFTVLRDGAHVATGAVASTTNEQLVSLMTEGNPAGNHEPAERQPQERLVFEARNIQGDFFRAPISFSLRRGEVLGLAGLMGSGRTELLRLLFGLSPLRKGQLFLDEKPLSGSVRRRMKQGLGLLSEDRKLEGLALRLSVAENLTLPVVEQLAKLGFVADSTLAGQARKWTERLQIRLRSVHQPVFELSGGNQQKVQLARLLCQDARVLLLDEPTRGIDIQSRAAIHELIDALANQGKALIVVSSHFPELLKLCDRIAVMRKGTLTEPRDGWTERELMRASS